MFTIAMEKMSTLLVSGVGGPFTDLVTPFTCGARIEKHQLSTSLVFLCTINTYNLFLGNMSVLMMFHSQPHSLESQLVNMYV